MVAVHPGGEAWVPLQQPELAFRVAHHFQLRATGPIQLADNFAQGTCKFLRHFAYVARPGLAFLRQLTFAHAHTAEQLATVGSQHDGFFITGDVRL